MATAVKVFYHRGLASLKLDQTRKTSEDSVYLLIQPYLGRSAVSATSSAADSDAAPQFTNCALIQVEAGKYARYEVNPPNRSVTADADSPLVYGDEIIQVQEGWTISLIEQT